MGKRAWKWWTQEEQQMWPVDSKKCRVCFLCKPFDQFHKLSRGLFGLANECKACRKPVSKQHFQNRSYLVKMFDRCKSRARLKNREFNIVISDLVLPETCPVLKVPLIPNTIHAPSVDRIDSSKGYIKGNIQIISKRANLLKNNASVEELEAVLSYMKQVEVSS